MKYADSLLELIGNTPLVRLHRTVGETRSLVLAKVEYLNPGGSVKDRIAVRMVEAAERSGALQPGGTLVEPAPGHTGVGRALGAERPGAPGEPRGRLPAWAIAAPGARSRQGTGELDEGREPA